MLSSASQHALKIVIYLAKHRGGGKIGGKVIAEELSLPKPFVGKILQALSNSGLLSSTKGPNGGFVLDELPEDISLLEIINIFNGKDAFKECLLNTCNCNKYNIDILPCYIHESISPAREMLINSLKNKKISDFL